MNYVSLLEQEWPMLIVCLVGLILLFVTSTVFFYTKVCSLRKTLTLQEKIQQDNTDLSHESIRLGHDNTTLKAVKEALMKQVESQQQKLLKLTEAYSTLKARNQERESHYHKEIENIEKIKQSLQQEFKQLAHAIFDDKRSLFTQENHHNMNLILEPFREQIAEFRRRVDTLHKEHQGANVELKTQLENLHKLNNQVTQDAQNLTHALRGDKKLAGNWGETQLQVSLQAAGLVQGEHYRVEETKEHNDGCLRRPDIIVNLPNDEHIIVDSKLSLVDFYNAVKADGEAEKKRSLDAHVKAIKTHVDRLYKKDYTNLKHLNGPNFVLVFIPIEPAFIEAIKHDPALFDYAYQLNIILVSHTTLMPVLRTISNLWVLNRGNHEAREISEKAGDIYNQFCVLSERLQKLGRTLNTATGHYNESVVALVGQQGLENKIKRFASLSENATKCLPKIEKVDALAHSSRIGTVAESLEED